MNRRMPARLAGGVLLAISLVLATAASAFAHVEISDGGAIPSGGSAVIHFMVPHGCSGAATTAISVQLPDGVVGAKPELLAGWTATTTMVPAKYTLYGTDYTERVGTIRWEGGPLPDNQFMEFAVSATFQMDPGDYTIPVVQECGNDKVSWIELPAAGQSEEDLEHPAPAFTVVASTGGDDHAMGGDMGSAAVDAVSARVTALEQANSSGPDTALIVAIVALVVGVVGLGVGVAATRRRS